MSTLTKVFIVLLVFSGIISTTASVSMLAQTRNWKRQYDDIQSQNQAADAENRILTAAMAAQRATDLALINAKEAEIGRLKVQLDTANKETEDLRLNLKQAVNDRMASEAINRGLLGELQASRTSLNALQTQRDDLAKQDLELQRRNTDLNQRINEETARIAVLVQQGRQYEQQINILKRENERLAATAQASPLSSQLENPAGLALPNIKAVTPVAATALRGKVLEVEGNIITISLGSGDGVKKEMQFVIMREGEYVADLLIQAVEPNRAAGKLSQPQMPPRVDDQVVDLGHLASK